MQCGAMMSMRYKMGPSNNFMNEGVAVKDAITL